VKVPRRKRKEREKKKLAKSAENNELSRSKNVVENERNFPIGRGAQAGRYHREKRGKAKKKKKDQSDQGVKKTYHDGGQVHCSPTTTSKDNRNQNSNQRGKTSSGEAALTEKKMKIPKNKGGVSAAGEKKQCRRGWRKK